MFVHLVVYLVYWFILAVRFIKLFPAVPERINGELIRKGK